MQTDAVFEQARLAFDRGDYNQAIDRLRDVLTENPEDAVSHGLLAGALVSTGRLHAARHEAGLATELSPEIPYTHFTAALVALAERKLPQANSAIAKAIELDPEDADIRFIEAQIHDAADKKDLAAEAIAKTLALEPEHLDAYLLKGTFALREGDLETAHAIAYEVLEQDPEHFDALVLMGNICLCHDDIEAARDHALWALETDPHDPDALALLVSIKIRQNRFGGLWWRYSAWISQRGTNNAILLIIGAFIVIRMAATFLIDIGQTSLSNGLSLVWLFFCIYTWSGSAIMQNMVNKELEQVRLRPDF